MNVKIINSKRLLFSASIIAIVGIAVIGATGAFFGDTETSVGNVFAAGALDLKVDNDSYYNTNRCVNVGTDENPDWQWQGNAEYPVPGTPCTTSWNLDDLSNGHLFFNFFDLKPDDEGEDTISLHVQNDAWACMDLTLTSNAENGVVEPEELAGDDPNLDGPWDGELAQHLEFVWWADDGDNVLEEGENILTGDHTVGDGVQTLYDLSTTTPFSLAIADAAGNIWGGNEPLPAGQTRYIAKAWCFGTLQLTPLAPGIGGPQDRGSGGYICDGTEIPNVNRIQTDGATLDVQFRAIQARHNPNFLCEPGNGLCGEVDVMLVLDRSSSIDGGELTTLKNAATSFVNTLAPSDPGAKVGMVSFGTTATLDQTLTFDGTDVNTAITAMSIAANSFTNLEQGILLATAELAANGRPGIDDIIVVITDGAPTARGTGGTLVTGPVADPPTANSDAAADAADAADAAGIEIFVAGVGTNAATETYLEDEIATVPANFFSAGDFDALEAILQSLVDCPNGQPLPI